MKSDNVHHSQTPSEELTPEVRLISKEIGATEFWYQSGNAPWKKIEKTKKIEKIIIKIL